jgi:hypothetical protein
MLMGEYDHYKVFQEEFHKELDDKLATCDILK